MKWANKATLEIYGDVDALQRIKAISIAMSEHGITGHGFSVKACDGKVIEKELGYWDGHGASSLHRLKLTEEASNEVSEHVMVRSIEPDGENGYNFKWIDKGA